MAEQQVTDALLPYTRRVIFLEEGDIAQINRGGVKFNPADIEALMNTAAEKADVLAYLASLK